MASFYFTRGAHGNLMISVEDILFVRPVYPNEIVENPETKSMFVIRDGPPLESLETVDKFLADLTARPAPGVRVPPPEPPAIPAVSPL